MQKSSIKNITPNEEYKDLNLAIGASIVFKREDMHPYGSHKGRSLPLMIDHYIKHGYKEFAISSSGNAGLASALYIKEINDKNQEKIKLEILIGNKVNKNKLNKLYKIKDENIRISQVEKPLQSLFERIKDQNIKSLRQSTDDIALLGYESLAQEISKIKDIKRIYIGTSSGTTAQALAQYFINNKNKIEVNIIQTSSCHFMVNEITEDIPKNEISIADAIVDQTVIRKNKVVELVKQTGGKGYIATNEEINNAIVLVKNNTGLDISTNSALSIVGLMKDSYIRDLTGTSVCIICGE
jgi:threonine dehydratase